MRMVIGLDLDVVPLQAASGKSEDTSRVTQLTIFRAHVRRSHHGSTENELGAQLSPQPGGQREESNRYRNNPER